MQIRKAALTQSHQVSQSPQIGFETPRCQPSHPYPARRTYGQKMCHKADALHFETLWRTHKSCARLAASFPLLFPDHGSHGVLSARNARRFLFIRAPCEAHHPVRFSGAPFFNRFAIVQNLHP